MTSIENETTTMTTNYCIHTITTPTIDYQTRIYFTDGYHEHIINGQTIDGHPASISHYEELIDDYMSTHLRNDDRYYTNLIIIIDDEDNIIIEDE